MIRFANPCTVCGATDEHSEWRSGVSGSPATFCPHPAEPGHGTGCCCAGLSRTLTGGDLITMPVVPSLDLGMCGTGPRHDRTGTASAEAHLGGQGYRAKVKVLTWAGCNGQRCGRDCGPGHHVVLWVPCQFAVGGHHHYTLSDGEIASLRDVLGMVP